MRIIQVLLSVLLIGTSNVSAQTSQKFLDSLYEEIDFLIGDSWHCEQTNNGFQVTYCRSCKVNYDEYINTTDFYTRDLTRIDFFQEHLIDSISYFSTVSSMPIPRKWTEEQRTEYFTNLYKPENILRFEIQIDKKWSEQKFNSTLSNNEQLKDSILKEPLYKSNMDIFSDYRFWIPVRHWKQRTKGLDFYFERLPYKSLILENSILIIHNKPFFFAEPMLIDKHDPTYFYKEENLLEGERRRVLKIIALVLGIHDYVIVN